MARFHPLILPALVLCAASHARQEPEDRLSAAGLKYFTDVRLVTQNGDSVRLYSDLLHAKVVVINSFFATCTGSCPMMSATLSALQSRLGDRLGKDVLLLSFSVDPQTDTPEALKEYAVKFHAKPGWLFLTGPKENVDFALSKLGQRVGRKEDHLTIFVVGNERTGLWKKAFAPTATADSLEAIVDSVLHDKG
jgi:protein SCO1/2